MNLYCKIMILINYLIFKLKKVLYDTFPIINGVIVVRGRGTLVVGKNVKINSSNLSNPVGNFYRTSFYISDHAKVVIGNNVGISNSLFYCNKSITIEDDVMIGGNCQILDNDFHSLSYEDRILNGDNNVSSKAICIKRGAFIGANSMILKGVTVGECSVIGAGSVVRKSIPADEIWAGNPAVMIKKSK